eukprot:176665-Pelagomonas_calceolata.AAC.1
MEGALREQTVHDWWSLDSLTPHAALMCHAYSKTMRTYHTHSGIPLGSVSGWWDERKRKKPLLPLYLR